jgi:pyrroline-5-carboxylate reductase
MSSASGCFAAPWRVRELPQGFVVEDAMGTPIGYTYFVANRMQSASASDGLTRDEACRIAANVARLPGLLVRK